MTASGVDFFFGSQTGYQIKYYIYGNHFPVKLSLRFRIFNLEVEG